MPCSQVVALCNIEVCDVMTSLHLEDLHIVLPLLVTQKALSLLLLTLQFRCQRRVHSKHVKIKIQEFVFVILQLFRYSFSLLVKIRRPRPERFVGLAFFLLRNILQIVLKHHLWSFSSRWWLLCNRKKKKKKKSRAATTCHWLSTNNSPGALLALHTLARTGDGSLVV